VSWDGAEIEKRAGSEPDGKLVLLPGGPSVACGSFAVRSATTTIQDITKPPTSVAAVSR
jgi:hypothetical protein